jgi:hypothetical protein
LTKELYGLGGWLKLFCGIVFSVAASFTGGGVFLLVYRDISFAVVGGCVLTAMGLFAFAVFALMCLHLRIAIKLSYIFLLAQNLFFLVTLFGGDAPWIFWGTVVNTIAWSLYLYHSKRVQNTFHSDEANNTLAPTPTPYRPFADVK